MKKTLILLISLFICFNSHAQHHVDYRISALGNLVYQLDCMTQVARFRCSNPSFTQLWQSEIKPDEKDEAMLKQWAELREKINKTINLNDTERQQQPTSANHPEDAANKVNLLEKIRIFAMASNKDDYLKTIGTVISAEYANSEAQVINYFQPRFDGWFTQQKPGLETFINEARILGEHAKVTELLTSLRQFYHSEIPEKMTLPVYLIAHPQQKAPTSGLVFAENSIIEVLKGEKAESRLGVVIHEIAHFYHERAPKTLHNLMMNHFVVNDSATGKVGYYLFNEAIATAIGNGIFEQRIKDSDYYNKYFNYPMSFYANDGIDTAAKSALDLVKSTIENGQSIDQMFLKKLDQLWGESLNHLKNKPKERFRHIGMIFLHNSANELLNEFFTLVGPSSAHMNTIEDLNNTDELITNQFTHLDTVIVVQTWKQLAQLKLDGLTPQSNQTEFSTIQNLPNNTARVIIVSKSNDYIKEQLRSILNKDTF